MFLIQCDSFPLYGKVHRESVGAFFGACDASIGESAAFAVSGVWSVAQLARITAQVAPGQSIGRALRLLACFSESHPSHTLSELSRQLELAPSTVSRLLSVLEEYGYVRRGSGTSHYTVGIAPIALASVAISQSDLRRQSLPFLEMLADTSHHNANLAVLYEGDVLFLARVPAAKELRTYTITGTRNAPHSTAVGKVLLAALPEEEVCALYTDRPLEAVTPRTITSMDALLASWSLSGRAAMLWMMRSLLPVDVAWLRRYGMNRVRRLRRSASPAFRRRSPRRSSRMRPGLSCSSPPTFRARSVQRGRVSAR